MYCNKYARALRSMNVNVCHMFFYKNTVFWPLLLANTE